MFNELLSTISLAFIVALLLFPYNSYRVDKLREYLFELRDELFDEALRGNISYESQAYRATRSVLNGMIRFSHQISFSRLIAARVLIKQYLTNDDFTRAMSASPSDDRVLCSSYLNRANELVILHVLSSPLVLIFIIPPVIALILRNAGFNLAGAIVQTCKKQFAEFDRIAFKEGQA